LVRHLTSGKMCALVVPGGGLKTPCYGAGFSLKSGLEPRLETSLGIASFQGRPVL